MKYHYKHTRMDKTKMRNQCNRDVEQWKLSYVVRQECKLIIYILASIV